MNFARAEERKWNLWVWSERKKIFSVVMSPLRGIIRETKRNLTCSRHDRDDVGKTKSLSESFTRTKRAKNPKRFNCGHWIQFLNCAAKTTVKCSRDASFSINYEVSKVTANLGSRGFRDVADASRACDKIETKMFSVIREVQWLALQHTRTMKISSVVFLRLITCWVFHDQRFVGSERNSINLQPPNFNLSIN